jgi:hypothetical protein
MLKLDPGVVGVINVVQFGTDVVDSSLVVFLSGCPILETLDIYFDPGFLAEVSVPPSSKRLKLTDRKFSWTYLEIDSDWPDMKFDDSIPKTKLGIIGNLQSVEEAYLDVFPCVKVNLSTQLSTSSEIKIMIYIYFCVILQRR